MTKVLAHVVSILKTASFVLEGVGMVLTLLRLWFRVWIQRLWWEDAWAAIAFLLGLTYFTSNLAYLCTKHVVALWIFGFSFTCLPWAVRMSLMFSIIRLMPVTRCRFLLAIIVSGFFGVMWASLMIQKGLYCGLVFQWHSDCHFRKLVVLYEFLTDAVSDITLVVISLRFLLGVKLPKNQRRLLISVFLSVVMSSIVSFFHGLTQITRVVDLMNAAANLEVAISLIVCNLLVIITYIYRATRREGDTTEVASSQNTTAISMSMRLTTVDINPVTGRTTSPTTLTQSVWFDDSI